jgi:hypothetical protein
VSRKYTQPKKKRKSAPLPVRAQSQATTGAAPAAVEFSMARPAAAKSAPVAQVDAVKYGNLPYELKRIGLFTAAALILLIAAWLILR